jgi:hypothetical protein
MANQNEEGPIFYNDFEGFGDDDDEQSKDKKKGGGDQKQPQPVDAADSLPNYPGGSSSRSSSTGSSPLLSKDDVVDSVDNDTTASQFVNFLQERSSSGMDWTAIQTRQFSLGHDLVLSNYVGNMGFDEVTDWEYYLQSEDGNDDRQVVQPNPFDKSKYVIATS